MSASQLKAPAPEYQRGKLIVSLLIFVCTFGYWFHSAASPLSIINVFFAGAILNRMVDGTAYIPATGVFLFAFWLHLAVTVFGLYLFYKSGFAATLADRIRQGRFIGRFFHRNTDTARKVLRVVKWATVILMIFTLYSLLLQLMAGAVLPRNTFGMFMFLFFIALVCWNMNYAKPEPDPAMAGLQDNRDKTCWIKLSTEQIAYVKDNSKSDTWRFYERGSDADFSYTQSYVFRHDLLSHRLPEQALVEMSMGKLYYSVNLVPVVLDRFPAALTRDQVLALHRFTDRKQINDIVYLHAEQSRLKRDMEAKYLRMSAYIADNPLGSAQEQASKYLSAMEDIKSLDIASQLTAELQEYIDNILGQSGIYFVDCSITHNSIQQYFETELKQALAETNKAAMQELYEIRAADRAEAREVRAAERNALHQERAIVLQALSERLKQPGIPPKAIPEILALMKTVRLDPTWNNIQQAQSVLQDLNHPPQQAEIPRFAINNGELMEAAKEIASTIMICKAQHYDMNTIKELISSASDILRKHNISVEEFVTALAIRWEGEKDERTEEAYQGLVRDTLDTFINNRPN